MIHHMFPLTVKPIYYCTFQTKTFYTCSHNILCPVQKYVHMLNLSTFLVGWRCVILISKLYYILDYYILYPDKYLRLCGCVVLLSSQRRKIMAGILRRQLALAVKNKQWSYAIFWSVSSAQNGYVSDQVFVCFFGVKISSFVCWWNFKIFWGGFFCLTCFDDSWCFRDWVGMVRWMVFKDFVFLCICWLESVHFISYSEFNCSCLLLLYSTDRYKSNSWSVFTFV